MKVGIIGGGIMGISLGYFLTKEGVEVDIYEASSGLGGLAGPLVLEDGAQVDRFYHTILSSDRNLRALCEELGIADQMRFKETRTGFYYKNEIHSMNNIIEFLRFPPLGWIDRFRLGLTILAAMFINDWRRLESISVKEWLIRWGGKNTYQNIWRPMLMAKFDGGFDDVPATWIWSRLVRMKSTRGGAEQKEEAGHLIGGYIILLNAMVEKLEAAGGKIHLQTPVQEIVIEDGQTKSLRVNDELKGYDAVVATVQVPIFQRLIPGAPQGYHEFLQSQEYLGVVCPLLVLDEPLTGYWTLNLTDDSIPFTGVIETTAYIDPQYVGGHHLVYLPKYTAPGSELQKKSNEEIKAIWLEHLQRMFPNFDPESIRYFIVGRERYVEPLHGLNETELVPDIQTPVEKLFLSTTAQIYPALTNGESVSVQARKTAEVVINSHEE
jgi:protoporphyrinogen oxidase